MIPQPLMSALLDSALARLAASLMTSDEFISPIISVKVAMLSQAIKVSNHEKRVASADILTQILKTLDTQDAIPLFISIVNTDLVLMEMMADDPLIQQRIRHIYRVAEIASIISKGNLRTLQNGINGLRKKIFEVSTNV